MNNCVNFANVGQKLIAQPFTFGRAFNQSGNVNKFQLRRRNRFRLNHLGQLVQTRVRNRHAAGVRLNRAKRKIGGLCSNRLGQSVKQRRLSDIRQTDNTAIKSHGKTPQMQKFILLITESFFLFKERFRTFSARSSDKFPKRAKLRFFCRR